MKFFFFFFYFSSVSYYSLATTFKIHDILQTRQTTQPVILCSKLTIETLKQGMKYVQS